MYLKAAKMWSEAYHLPKEESGVDWFAMEHSLDLQHDPVKEINGVVSDSPVYPLLRPFPNTTKPP